MSFSVIVPMRSVARYADGCLTSIRRQTATDLEIIAVDDDSPDDTGAIIDRHARADDRIVAVHLAASYGVGHARNQALARATGDYVLFLDGDDVYTDDSVLRGVESDLRATGRPDILLFDYQETRPCGLVRRPPFVAVDGARSRLLVDHPDLLRASWVCWNKAYRRDFLTRGGFAFPIGYYEDFVWSICTLLSAHLIGVSGRVCVDYRNCRDDSISGGPSPHHFEVFDQFDRIFAFLDDHPELDFPGARQLLHDSMGGFLWDRSDRVSVIPPDLLDDFRRRSDEFRARPAFATREGN